MHRVSLPLLAGASLLITLVGVEAAVQHRAGLPTAGVQQFVAENDELRIFNRRYYEQHQDYFRGRSVPPALFDGEGDAPAYLFKPNVCLNNWSTNSWGFRGPEFPVTKPKGTIRIVCLGASTTNNSTLSFEANYPFLLQQALTARVPHQQIEVINAGHEGLTSQHLLAVLRQRVLPLQPDVVLFYEGNNGVLIHDFSLDLPCHVGMPFQISAGNCWQTTAPQWVRWLSARSAVFSLLWRTVSSPPYPPLRHTFDDTLPKPSLTDYAEALRHMVQEARTQGSLIVLSSFVSLASDGLSLSPIENPVVFNDLYRELYPFTPKELARIYELVNQQSARVASEYGIPYADVAAAFPRQAKYFPYDIIHLNEEGNKILAGLFADFLAKEVLPQFLRSTDGVAQGI